MLNRNPDTRPSPEEILAKPKLQEIMKKMLDEAQEQAQVADEPSGRQPEPEPNASGPRGGVSEGPMSYRTGDLVEYFSVSHGDWLPATVLRTDGEGRIIIDLKPNTWLSKEDQASKVRRRRDSPASRAGSPMRTPSVAGPDRNGFRGGAFRSPQIGRSPSSGGVGGLRQGSRPGSRAGSPGLRRSPALAAGAIAGIGSRPGSGISSRPGSRGASPSNRAPSPRNGDASYRKGDLVDYWSISHGEWLPATVVNTDTEGRVVIDLKPNTWLTKEDQASKMRRRMVGTPGLVEGGQIRRTPSADHFGAPYRAPSPRHIPSPGRAMSPHRAPSPSWRGFADPPIRAPSPRRREPTPRRSVPGMPPAGGPHMGDSPLLRAGGKNIAGGYLPP